MWGSKVVSKAHEVVPVHVRTLKHFVRHREFLGGDTQITKNLICKTLRKLTIVALDQRHAFIAIDVARTDFLRRIVGSAAYAKLGEGGVVMKVINPVDFSR